MRLSEAIRLGAMMKPQAFGSETNGLWSKPTPTLGLTYKIADLSCAWQAAFDAEGLSKVPVTNQRPGLRGGMPATHTVIVPDQWFQMVELNQECPQCAIADLGYRIIAHINDQHHWTRERIADWVETIENAQSVAVQPEAAEVP